MMRLARSPFALLGLRLLLACSITMGTPGILSAQQPETTPATRPAETTPAAKTPPQKRVGDGDKTPARKRTEASIHGKVVRSAGGSPLPGAVVHAMAPDGTVHSSAPADTRGRYLLPSLAPGTYRLAVVTEEGLFSLETPVGIVSANDFTVDLATVHAEGASGMVPGVEAPPRGFSYILQRKNQNGTVFWRGPKGITVLVG